MIRLGERPPRAPTTVTAPGPDRGRIVRLRAQDGIELAVRIFDAAPSARLPLLCLPGLSRNSRDFLDLGRFFSRRSLAARKVIAVDYRGRGLSDPDPHWRNYSPFVEGQDVLAACAALGIDKAIVVGTSRGGIIAMLLGALRPTLLAGVVLNDIGPVIEGIGLARIKSYLSVRRSLRTWDDAIAACRDMAGGQFPALRDDDWRAFAEAYFVETANGLSPQFDPNLLRVVEAMDPAAKVPDLWPQFESLANVPLLAIRGEFSDLLSPRTLNEMADRHPGLERLTVPGQGHPPLLRDAATLERISSFAERCESSD